jgi:hypothetical protein
MPAKELDIGLGYVQINLSGRYSVLGRYLAKESSEYLPVRTWLKSTGGRRKANHSRCRLPDAYGLEENP